MSTMANGTSKARKLSINGLLVENFAQKNHIACFFEAEMEWTVSLLLCCTLSILHFHFKATRTSLTEHHSEPPKRANMIGRQIWGRDCLGHFVSGFQQDL